MSRKLTESAIRRHLRRPMAVEVMDRIDSTNTEAKRRSMAGHREPLLLLARTQTAGRGRLGRIFCSPEGAGLYMSLLLHPEMRHSEVLSLTSAAAVAVCEAVEELTDLAPRIKWVNDVYIGDKKVCGILTEGVSDPLSGALQSVVVGIGINLTPAAFPEEVAAIATSLAEAGAVVDPNRLAAQICDRLLGYYERIPQKGWLLPYRERSYLQGKEVSWRMGGADPSPILGTGVVVGIGEEGELLLSTAEGEVALTGGEVTVRIKG